MMAELIIISVSVLVLITLYIGRLKSATDGSKLFSNSFLVKMDEIIFDFVKFFFKLYMLVMSNLSSFLKEVPHRIIHGIHKISHALAQKSNIWVDKIKAKTHMK